MTGGGARDVPGGSPSSKATRRAPGDNAGTGVQTDTRGQVILDPEWEPLRPNLQPAGDYHKVQMTGHPIADANGRIRVHRLVLHDAIGPGPHPCHWCRHDGLVWCKEQRDPNYLTVDHLDGNKANDRRSNLAPTHKWCNDNRHVIEDFGIPWEFIATIPVADRKPVYNHVKRCPTTAAFEYQRRARGETQAEPLERPTLATTPKAEAPGKPTPLPIRKGFVRWEDLVG